eukprot:m.1646814 g.1646814  ORF g.1646814 m.1646814 type:complete len:87 (+) comp72955_c0_seq1:1-261(+)
MALQEIQPCAHTSIRPHPSPLRRAGHTPQHNTHACVHGILPVTSQMQCTSPHGRMYGAADDNCVSMQATHRDPNTALVCRTVKTAI